MTKVITIITSNKGKINSLKVALSGLDYEVKNMNLDLLEPQFDTIEEVAEFKAKQAFDKLKSALLVHDGGLIIPSLNGFPGVYTKYASTTLGPQDFVNLMKEKEDKSCYLTQCLIYVDENGELHKFQDKLMGSISNKVADTENEAAWGTLWQVFIPKGSERTLAELPEEEYLTKIRPIAKTNSVWEDLKDFLIRIDGRG